LSSRFCAAIILSFTKDSTPTTPSWPAGFDTTFESPEIAPSCSTSTALCKCPPAVIAAASIVLTVVPDDQIFEIAEIIVFNLQLNGVLQAKIHIFT
jgi:hypothetical protein